MRIGAFSKKHQVTQDAVRFYLEKGLLVAHKRGEQYYFTSSRSAEWADELANCLGSLFGVLLCLTLFRRKK